MTTGFAATEAGGKLKEFQYDLGPLGDLSVGQCVGVGWSAGYGYNV